MAKFLLIMTEGGLPLYTAPLEEPFEFDQFLLTGFLSALHSFSKEIASGELSSIKLGELFMNFFRKDGLLFVIAHDQSIPERIISCLLEDLSQEFLSKYKDFLYQGPLSDTYLFQGFKDDFHAVLKKYKRMEDLPVFWGDLKKFHGLEKEIFALCDGTRTIGEIAKELGKVYFDVMRIIVTQKEKSLRLITKSRWVLE